MENILIVLLILVLVILAYYIGKHIGQRIASREIEKHRADAVTRSRAVLGGQFAENLAPFLPDFPFNPNECRFIGKPVDFLVFKGMDEKSITEVIFVEVKSGDARLSGQERNLKEAIENKRVSFAEYRIHKEITL